ncbi:tumor suppressor candidate 3-like [Cydia amplana]|uniref:tumor suppressor candidate 3-like n=1 Tax=Cydia amplana TaxID=1869771 RepID=UPI002FE5069D
MVLCFAMVSGYTWNKMRKPAFSYKSDKGPVFISSGQKQQFVAESYIVAVLNGATVLGMILTIEGAGGVRTERDGRGKLKRRKLQMLAGIGLMFASFAVLVAAFKIKRPWYPYGF